MSKIYEALLRAEQERPVGTASGEAVDGSSPEDVDENVTALEQGRVGDLAESSFEDTAGTFPLPQQNLETPSASSRRVDLAPASPGRVSALPSANVEVWRPDLSKLPALTPRGVQVEQFRGLRSKLFEFRSLNPLKTILVSSALPSEGKSFVAVNLALTLARHKSARVLLIDGDLRRHSQQKLLGASNEPGLAEYLAGKAALHEILLSGASESAEAPLPLGLASLTFIPSGNAGDKAADLAGSSRFPELLSIVSPHFDWIIVDSSPVNLVSDGVIFARACDGVLFIARGGVTKLAVAQRALSELKASKVLGVVLNAIEDAPAANGYYGYEGYDSNTA